jgi:hypothetical protein
LLPSSAEVKYLYVLKEPTMKEINLAILVNTVSKVVDSLIFFFYSGLIFYISCKIRCWFQWDKEPCIQTNMVLHVLANMVVFSSHRLFLIYSVGHQWFQLMC